MIRLLKLELLKNLNYKPFKIFTALYFIVLICLLFVGLVNFDLFGGEVNLKEQGFYDFPGIWNFITYSVAILKIFLGCIIVFSICQEFSNRMFKQNLIDGLGRGEFIQSKLITIFSFTILSTVIVFIIGLYLGKTYSVTQKSDLVFKEIYFILCYFIKLLTFFSLMMFLSILFRKSIFVFLGLFMLWFVEGVLSAIEKFAFARNLLESEKAKYLEGKVFLTDYLPLSSMSNLIPSPLMRTTMAKAFGIIDFKFELPVVGILICLAWSAIFIGGSYWILKKKDW